MCAEVKDAHGIELNDLGIEKLWEWSGDGPDGFGATIVGQLLLMALERGQQIGYSVDDLADFLHTANGSGSTH
ncbi:MAG TPA: hypothetical protein VHX38_19615 [Pseudonocardiaceae bacterium]|nr:hypothetical protein [Pseudonocardiaceae bacterium]